MNRLWFATIALLMAFALTACEEQGPAERAGEEIDEAVENVGDSLEEGAEEIEDEVDDATDGH